MWKFAPGI